MLSIGNTLGTSGASLSLDTRVAVGAGVFAVSAVDARPPEPESRVITTPEPKLPAYNAFEFSYRSDFGKIILLQQNVDTGEELTQVPTEYHLRQYAASQREQRVQLQQKLYKGSAGSGESQDAAQVVVVTTAAKSGVSPTPTAPSASPPASPSVAPSTVAAAAAAHVDIKA